MPFEHLKNGELKPADRRETFFAHLANEIGSGDAVREIMKFKICKDDAKIKPTNKSDGTASAYIDHLNGQLRFRVSTSPTSNEMISGIRHARHWISVLLNAVEALPDGEGCNLPRSEAEAALLEAQVKIGAEGNEEEMIRRFGLLEAFRADDTDEAVFISGDGQRGSDEQVRVDGEPT